MTIGYLLKNNAESEIASESGCFDRRIFVNAGGSTSKPPYRKPRELTEEQRSALADRLVKARAGRQETA